MCKIKIIVGPDSYFDTYIPDNTLSLEKYISFLDSERNNILIKYSDERKATILNNKVVVGKTDSYSSFNVGFIQNFLNDLEDFMIYGKGVILQNPPQKIVDTIQANYKKNEDYKIIKYEYSQISKKIIRNIKNKLDECILGQERAEKQIISSLYELYKNKDKEPLVLMLYGPSGVGKTETAKIISKALEGDLLRIQMSMYKGNTAFDYIFGSDHNKTSLAKDFLRRENNVILLDEFGRSNPEILSAFYQMFDEGVFEDSNYKVDISNSIIICTSNFLSLEGIRQSLGDPIYYRFNEFIKFEELNQNTIIKLIKRVIDEIYSSLTKKEREIVGEKDVLYKRYSEESSSFINYRHINNLIKNDVNRQIIEEFFY
ncbi:AAA family ATPase [Vagococcus fluvialis]|uniref:AAA family ATPase n=1 Tax=Vagococcus fluvialis TaxID=2738 RepID=UPI001D0A4C0D|nr:AAA family ATPase [Vagococcus fluvialis]UDM80384.1 AAA family ATPase [Vagococcus fluvialis]